MNRTFILILCLTCAFTFASGKLLGKKTMTLIDESHSKVLSVIQEVKEVNHLNHQKTVTTNPTSSGKDPNL